MFPGRMECPDTVSEQASTPPADPVAELRTQAEADLGALFGDAPEKGKADAAGEGKGEAGGAAPVAVDAKAVEDKAKAPDAVQAPDLSWAPEHLRPKLSSLDPEVAKALKDGWLRQSDYTKKTQALSEERKAIERAKEKAALWERLEANPAAALAAQRVLEGKSPVEAEASQDEDVDLLTMDPKALRAWVAKQARVEAERIAEEKIRARVEAPVARASGITSALNDYAADLGLSESNAAQAEAFRGAVAEAAEVAREMGLEVTAANVVRFVKPYVEKAIGAGAKNETARDTGKGLAGVASPTSRTTATVPPKSVPTNVREGRAPKNDRERERLAMHVLEESFGVNATPDELERLLSK